MAEVGRFRNKIVLLFINTNVLNVHESIPHNYSIFLSFNSNIFYFTSLATSFAVAITSNTVLYSITSYDKIVDTPA